MAALALVSQCGVWYEVRVSQSMGMNSLEESTVPPGVESQL